nr:MAG TPA: bacteriocin [Caudoviricetes sp.]
MSVRTISVTINGLNDIEAKTKLLNNMKATVLDIERMIKEMGRSNNLPSINLKLNIDTSDIQRQINNVNALVSKASGSSIGGSGKLKDQTIEVNNFAESWKNVGSAMSMADRTLTSLTSNMIKLGAVNPAKTMLSGLKSVSYELLNIQKSFTSLVNGKLTSSFQGMITSAVTTMKQGVAGMVSESQKVGDAMQIYRVNMSSLGFSDKDVNKSLKRLGDYGKASVYDASDLLNQASTYYAYNRKDSEDIVKAFAGLIAQTNNPVQGIKTAGEQTAQMLANGYLNQQDFKFTRERFSALGASEVNKRLLALAQSKGYSSIIKATQDKAITADEFLDVIKEVGNSPKFQSLVTSILTPKQAIENLKETLSNLLVFDKVDEDGNSSPGALNKVYVATRDFIKSITDLVGSEKFEGYVRKLGDAIGTGIENVNKFSRTITLTFGDQLIKSMEKFGKDFTSSLDGNVMKSFQGFMQSLIDFLNESGNAIGHFVSEAGNAYIKYLTSWVNIGRTLVSGGILDAITSVIEAITNLQEIAVHSGAVRALAEFIKGMSDTFKHLTEATSFQNGASTVVKSIKGFADQFVQTLRFLIDETPIIDVASKVISSVFDFFSNFVKLTREGIKGEGFRTGLKALGNVVKDLLDYLAPVLARITSSALNALTSGIGIRFFKALSNFVKAVVTAIENVIKSFGGGNLQEGFKKILGFLTTIVETFAKIAEVLGHVGKYLIIGALIGKASNIVSSIVSFISTTVSSLGQLNNFALPAKTKQGVAGGLASGQSLLAGGGLLSGFFNRRADKYYSKKSQRAFLANDSVNGEYFAGLALQARNNAKEQLKLSKVFKESVQAYKNVRANGGTFRQAIGAGFDKTGNLGQALKTSGLAIGGMFGGMALDGINNAVQSSKLSSGMKQASTVLTSTASGALSGAAIGSMFTPIGTAIGAGIGGFVGLIQGLFTNDAENQAKKEQAKLEAEAKKQKEEQDKVAREARVQALKQEAKQYGDLMRNFYKSVTNDSSVQSDLTNSLALVTGNAGKFGGDLSKGGSNLGLATEYLPNDVDNYTVNISGQEKTWAQWKEELGVTDLELMKSLQALYGSWGQKYVELKNSTDGTVATIQTLSDTEFKRQETSSKNFTDAFNTLNIATQKIPEIPFKKIAEVKDQLDYALNGRNFSNKEDQDSAIQKVLMDMGASEEKVINASKEDLYKWARTLDESATANSRSNDEVYAEAVDELKKVVNKTKSKVWKNLLDSFTKEDSDLNLEELINVTTAGKALDETDSKVIQYKLQQASKMTKEKINELTGKNIDDVIAQMDVALVQEGKDSKYYKEGEKDLNSILEKIGIVDSKLRQKIIDKVIKSGESIEKAIQEVADDKGALSEEDLSALKLSANNFYNVIGELKSKGQIKLEKANELLKGIPIDLVDVSKLTPEGQALVEELKTKVDKTTGKIKEAKDKVKGNDPKDVDTSKISEEASKIEEALNSLVNSVANAVTSIFNSTPKSVSGGGGKGKKKGKRKQFGGIIPEYHSDGDIIGVDWTPRGTDTVPTMLTPGEYVLRRKAVESLGLNFLNNLNKYGNKALQSNSGQTIINNVYNTNNAKISQNIDNKSQYLNGLFGIDRLMRYV